MKKFKFLKFDRKSYFLGLSNLISIRDETEAAIEAVRGIGDEDCIDGVVSTWQEQLRLVGATIQTCGNSHMSSLYNNTVGFHEFINENRQMKFDAQNIVIQTFTEVNLNFKRIFSYFNFSVECIDGFHGFITNS